MKKFILPVIIFFAAFNLGLGQATDPAAKYDKAYAAWEAAAFDGTSPLKAADAFEALRREWHAAPETVRIHVDYYYAQAAVHTAHLLVSEGKHDQAATVLKEAGLVAKSYPIVPSRGRSPSAFKDMAAVHASVVAATKVDPLQGLPTGYELGRTKDGFYALQEDSESEPTTSTASMVPLEGLAPDETEGSLLLIDQKGDVLKVLRVAIKNGAGSLRSRLAAIFEFHEASPSGPSGYTRKSPKVVFSE